jgi:hypothetical protein
MFKRAKTIDALDRAATVISNSKMQPIAIKTLFQFNSTNMFSRIMEELCIPANI